MRRLSSTFLIIRGKVFAQDFDTVYSNSQQQKVLLKDDELTRTTVVLLLVLEESSGLRFVQDFDTVYSKSQQQKVLLKDDELTRTVRAPTPSHSSRELYTVQHTRSTWTMHPPNEQY